MSKHYASGQTGQPGPGQYGYLAGLHGATLEVYAPTKAAALRAALDFWKPFKKDRAYVWVELAEKPDGTPVVHVVVD
jgi:hypothetical protein